MAPITEYNAELLEFASRNMKGLLRPERDEDAKLVQKGLMLYRQGLVYQLRFDGDIVAAGVQDVTPVQVKLDLSFLETSQCSCPEEGFCRHQLAVFFHALSQVASVATWVEDWRQPIKAKTAATNWGLQTARDLLKASKKPEANYQDWSETFLDSFQRMMVGNGQPNPYVVPELFRVYWRRIKADSPIETEWRTLYELIANMHSFMLLADLSEEFGHTDTMVDRYYRHLFHGMIEDIEKAIARLSITSMPFAFDGFIEKLKDDASGLLEVSDGLAYEGIHLYRLLWSQLFKKSPWHLSERERLEELAMRNPDYLPVQVGLIHQDILAKKDDEGLELLANLEMIGVPYMLYWLEQFTFQKEWKRIGPFIDLFVSRLNGYLRGLHSYDACIDFTGMALDLVVPYCEEVDRADLLERTLVQSLPYSFRVYDTFLFKQRGFEKWVELQAFIGAELPYLEKERVKEVQKQDPGALLPLYHQAIADNIELKNRASYREAVKLLKKLRTIYKKLGRLADWERFLTLLLMQTKRLRAFQEECKRGKLIDA